MKRASLPPALRETLAAHDVELASLYEHAEAIVLFGSRVATPDDAVDWDVLAVGDGLDIHTRRLDLVWVAPNTTGDPTWLCTELATHVCAFGILLHGSVPWCRNARVTEDTVARKRSSILARLRALERFGDRLRDKGWAAYRRTIRRDVQRLAWLRQHQAVPPRPTLDAAWRRVPDWHAWMSRAGLEPDVLSPLWEHTGDATG